MITDIGKELPMKKNNEKKCISLFHAGPKYALQKDLESVKGFKSVPKVLGTISSGENLTILYWSVEWNTAHKHTHTLFLSDTILPR